MGTRAALAGKKVLAQKTAGVAAVPLDEGLKEYLREWRRSVAVNELLEVPGIGEKKAETYGREILAALARFRQGERAGGMQLQAKPAEETLRLLSEGKTLEEMAQVRGRQLSTIVSAVANLLETGLVEFQPGWVSKEKQSVIEAACAKVGMARLKPLKDILPPEVTYDEIRLVVGRLRREEMLKKADVPA
jgi:ATP-dependent DNA helicase RecQ